MGAYDTTTSVTDEVTDNLAQYHNELRTAILHLMSSVPYAAYGTPASMTGDIVLTDADFPVLSYSPTAARNLTLPAIATTNHAFFLINRSGTYAITVLKPDTTTLTTVSAGGTALLFSDGANSWYAILSGGGMSAATYDPANIAEQLVGLTATQTLTNKTLTNFAMTHQTLTDGATINWNLVRGASAQVTLGGSRTMAAPTNLKRGLVVLTVKQDATGGRGITWSSAFKNTPQPYTTASATTIFSWYSDGTSLYYIGGKKVDTYSETAASGNITPDTRNKGKNNLVIYCRSALSEGITVNADANGSHADGDKILFRYKDNGTSRTITHNAQYASLIAAMITATTASKWSYELFEWNATDSKYYCVASGTQS